MNDFTKGELQEIYGLLEHHYCDPEKCFNPNPKLLLKIESMIDNYKCIHESDGKVYELQPEYKCKNCGEFYI